METRKTRSRSKPDITDVHSATIKVFTGYLGEETERQEVIEVRKFETEPAYLRVNAGVTKNMGNYESLRVDVSLSIPCYVEEMEVMLPKVADRVAAFLDDEVKNYTSK